MCGIAGVLAGPLASPVEAEELRRMVAMLGHRGPDGHGFYRASRVGLGHARLGLVDLDGGAQPIRNEDGSLWLTFNGEIFNYLELRRRLLALGHRFYTNGDSEVIVHCYQRFGPDAWQMFNGQFAFALWDSVRRQLWLVRDRVGIVPLHYARIGDHLVFASEAKALFAGGRLSPRFDPQGLSEVFTNWSATAPATVFAGIAQVPPATALRFDFRLEPREFRYWRPDPEGGTLDGLSATEAAEGLEERLDRAVALRLRADVPVGAYISGGLDSAVIGSLAKARAAQPLETFGISFADPRFDEAAAQRHVAGCLGTRHHEMSCDGADIRAALAEVVWHAETPLLRTAPVPMFLLSGLVRRSGIKTVLTGEGADELLAGYTIFKEDQIRRFWARRPDSVMRPALLARIHHYVGAEAARATGLWQQFFGRDLTDTGHPFYSHLIRWRNTAWTLRLLAPSLRADGLAATMAAAEADLPPGWGAWTPLRRAQAIEMRGFLSSYLLSSQGDRVAMAHGIEARYPFLDPEMVDYCLALPQRHKLIGSRDKLALRRLAARRQLPPAVWGRRKQPFRAPIGAVLFGAEGAEEFATLLAESEGLFDAAAGRLAARAWRLGGEVGEREEMGLVGVVTLAMLARGFGRDFARRAQQARTRLDRSPPQVQVEG